MKLEDKIKKLDGLFKQWESSYGKENVPTDGNNLKKIEFMSTGILGVDLILGGGWAYGRIAQTTGNKSSGKTTLAYETIAYNQKIDKDFTAYIYDAECATDTKYMKSLGIDLSRVIIDQSQSVELGLKKFIDACDTGVFNLAILDSTGALGSEKNEKEVSIGMNANLETNKVLGNFYTNIKSIAAKYNMVILVIEWLRQKIGVMFGNPEIYSRGSYGEYAFSQAVVLRAQSKKIEGKDNLTGEDIALSNEIKLKTWKNKVYPPFRTCTVTVEYGRGFNPNIDLANLSIQLNLCEKKGAHIYYPNKDQVVYHFKSMDEFLKALDSNKDLHKLLDSQIRDKFKKFQEEYENTIDTSQILENFMADSDKTEEINIKKQDMLSVKQYEDEVEVNNTTFTDLIN